MLLFYTNEEGLKKIIILSSVSLCMLVFYSCSTTKKKQDVKGLKKLYHNTTAKFNGYFNAEEIMDETIFELQEMHVDNYNAVLSVYDYIDVENPQSIKANMDKAIEKVSVVATVHDVSNYVDDCYLIIGKAQYLKQDYVAAEETFQYFEEVFDPKNPYGRAYNSKSRSGSSSGRRSKKEIAQARKELQKEREAEKKEREKEREEEKKAREQERKEKDKARKEEQRQREKEKKERSKSRERGSRSSSGNKKYSSRAERDAAKNPQKEETTETTVNPEDSATKTQLSDEQEAAFQQAREDMMKETEEEQRRREKLEKDKEAERKKEEEKYKNQGEGAIFKNKSAYVEGLYWLGRTYIETERFSSAEYVFNELEQTPGLKDNVARMIPAARAHLYLRTKEYNSALEALEAAIEQEKKRNLKARYAFIKAQLYEGLNANQSAYAEYTRAKKFSTLYELDFNAGLNELKLGYREGSVSKKKALNKLDNMLADRKNNEYTDQIHFTIAQILLDGGDVDGAIESFELAVNASSRNPNVKLEAYLKLADILFDNGMYRRAKENYDQALELMRKTDDRYRPTERLSENLTEISDNIKVVETQDSLLALSQMPEGKLREKAEEIIRQRLEAGEPVADENPNFRKSNIIVSNAQRGAGRSNFFAYNPNTLNQGKVDFKRTWGERVHEDNWRRSLRANVGLTAEEIVLQDEEEEEAEITEDQIRELLRDVPRNPTQIASSQKRIQNALFQLGVLFRERIRNYQKSVDVLSRLVTEFPDYEKRDEALFYLYLSYLELDENGKANNVLAEMRQKYPDSKFTKLATDPEYAKKLKEESDSIEKYYEDTFILFQEGQYQTVLDRISEKDKLYARNKTYAPKFELLNAMSLGNIKGKREYIDALQSLVRSHPRTPEETRAKEILRFLKGDDTAFDQILYEEALDDFEDAPDKLHYMFVVTYELDQSTFDNTKVQILNYNKKFHRFDNLKISNIYLNQENKARIILIRSFDDKEKSMKYYEGVQKNKELFITNPEIGYDIFAVTQKNYREVIKQKSINNYRVFFEQKYKGND